MSREISASPCVHSLPYLSCKRRQPSFARVPVCLYQVLSEALARAHGLELHMEKDQVDAAVKNPTYGSQHGHSDGSVPHSTMCFGCACSSGRSKPTC